MSETAADRTARTTAAPGQCSWLERAGAHIDRLARLGRRTVVAVSWYGVLVLVVWFVVGVLRGFVTLPSTGGALLGAGGLGSLAAIGRRFDESSRNDTVIPSDVN